MEDMEIEKIESFCKKYGIQPSKERGQNFLMDASITQMMADVANLSAGDNVIEIGPGFGALTTELAKRVKKVVAVEVDNHMYRAAKDILGKHKNLEIVHEDILRIQNERIVELLHNPPPPSLNLREGDRLSYKVVANLPYSITSAILRKFTEQEPKPTLMVVMVQKEVAERVCAEPGEMSILSVAVQYYGKPEIVALVPRTAFWPEPEVDSAILRFVARSPTPGGLATKQIDEKRLFQVVRIGFSSRRKQLQNNLSAGLKMTRPAVVSALAKVGLDAKVRAQELSVANWIALAGVL